MKTIPMTRPSSRWAYSNQKMRLNSSTDMPRLMSRYSGESR